MNRSSCVWTVSAVLGTAVALAGCQAKPKPVPPPPPAPEMSAAQQRAADTAAFGTALGKYDADLAGLPGHTEPDHRAAAAATLADLKDALRLAYGMRPSPEFTNDLAILDAAARTVAITDVPRGRMEAAENQALHAAVAGLGEIGMRVLYDDAALPPLIDAANAKAVAARVSQGPLHDGDATDAFAAIGTALHQVDAGLQERFAKPVAATDPVPPPAPATMPTPAKMPATMPATMPTTGPATMPAAMPASMPTTMP